MNRLTRCFGSRFFLPSPPEVPPSRCPAVDVRPPTSSLEDRSLSVSHSSNATRKAHGSKHALALPQHSVSTLTHHIHPRTNQTRDHVQPSSGPSGGPSRDTWVRLDTFDGSDRLHVPAAPEPRPLRQKRKDAKVRTYARERREGPALRVSTPSWTRHVELMVSSSSVSMPSARRGGRSMLSGLSRGTG